MAVVTYTGASRVRRATGYAGRAYVFYQGTPLRIYAEDVPEVTKIAADCWIIEEEPQPQWTETRTSTGIIGVRA